MTREDVWEILPKSSLPTSAHIIILIQSFKRKRNPFRKHIKQGTSKIFYIEANEQQADIMTKPLDKPQFEYLRK